MDTSVLLNYLLWGGLFVIFFVLLLLFQSWKFKREVMDKKTGRHKMMAQMRGVDGFPRRELVPIDENGRTVTINGQMYVLTQERKSEGEGVLGTDEERGEEMKSVPTMHILYPKSRFMGLGPQTVLRFEEWAEGNPEPIQPWYAKFIDVKGNAIDPGTEGAVFVKSRLMVTASEIRGLINEAHLAAATVETEEIRAMQKSWRNVLANLPNKTLLYLMSGGSLVVGAICAFMLMRLSSG